MAQMFFKPIVKGSAKKITNNPKLIPPTTTKGRDQRVL